MAKIKINFYYKKSCKCDGTSSAKEHVRSSEKKTKTGVIVTITYYHGLGCDVCGKPWKKVTKK